MERATRSGRTVGVYRGGFAMIIQGMFERGAMPVLERLVQFTDARHRVLTDDIANLSTPFFKPRDLDPQSFQAALGEAIDKRRGRAGADPTAGPLEMIDTRELRFSDAGLTVAPQETHEGILYHDQNNRDLERLMQHLAENTLMHRAGIDLLRNQFDMMRLAIRERV
jgi:flagellar basal-body rod protein FlgB